MVFLLTFFLWGGGSFLLACLVRKFASYSLLNGFMSKEQADDVFPEWRKK